MQFSQRCCLLIVAAFTIHLSLCCCCHHTCSHRCYLHYTFFLSLLPSLYTLLIAFAITTPCLSLQSLHHDRCCCQDHTLIVVTITVPWSLLMSSLHVAHHCSHIYTLLTVITIAKSCSFVFPSLHLTPRCCHHHILLVAVATTTYCSSLLPSVLPVAVATTT